MTGGQPPRLRALPPDVVQEVEPRLVETLNGFLTDAGNAFDSLLTPNRVSQVEADVTFRTGADGAPSPGLLIANRLPSRPRALVLGAIAPVDGHNYVPDEAFDEVSTFTNSWVNFGSTNDTAGYFIEPSGRVQFKGVIKNGTVANAAFTLPEKYRPPARKLFAVTSNSTIGEVLVETTGVVTPTVGNNAYFTLANITYFSALGPSTYRPIGLPIWSINQRNQLSITRIPGLVPNTAYRATFLVYP